MRKKIWMAAVALLVAAAATAPPHAAAETSGSWCKTYCDVISKGCDKTLGLLDDEACPEWFKGCMDGCRVNE